MKTALTSEIKELLSTPKNCVIVGHKNPDGDAVGSCLGLDLYLKSIGQKSQVVMPNDFPDFLKWLPSTDTILNFEKQNIQSVKALDSADVIFTLDFNSLSRVATMQETLEKSNACFVMIDHHQKPDTYAQITYSDTTMGSTCEMVYHFIDALEGLKIASPVGRVEMRACDHQVILPMFLGVTKVSSEMGFAVSSDIYTLRGAEVMPSCKEIQEARGQ